MRTRLVVIMVLVVVLPLAMLAWLGARLSAAEQRDNERRFHDLAAQRLADLRTDVSQHFAAQAREFEQTFANAASWTTDEHDDFMRSHPTVRQTFVLDRSAYLMFPAGPDYTESEQQFFERLNGMIAANSHLFDDPREVLERANTFTQQTQQLAAAPMMAAENIGAQRTSGWSAWYDRAGIELMYFVKTKEDTVIGAELNRTRLVSDIIALLPDTSSSATSPEFIRLLDENNRLIYQFGEHSLIDSASPFASIPLEHPLSSWKLEYFASQRPSAGIATRFGLWSGLFAAGIAMLGLMIFLHREYMRDMKEARQRVNFVSQVSHELKTPLTNIRMYAELLEEEIDSVGEEERRQLGIIVSESQRLTRLIENVLTFSRDGRGGIKLRPRPVVIDDVLRQTVEQFTPIFAEKGMKVVTEFNAPASITCDADAIRQVIGNLLANAEKYAAAGGIVSLSSSQNNAITTIRVSDKGPGIPPALRDKVFEPFYRVDNSITSGAAGAGIGLSIARNLARMHGGDLKLVKFTDGCDFELNLPNNYTVAEKTT